jgi:hypothetical protein
MMASIYMKLAGAGLILVLLGGLFLWGDHHGAARVQAKWDAQKVVDAAAVAKAETNNALQTTAWQNAFNGQEVTYAKVLQTPAPTVAPTVSAAVTAGALRLRYSAVCPSSGDVSAATARSRTADAVATQALADRVTAAIAAVRAGDAADARERQLDAQVTALQGVLIAERKKDTP